MAMHLRTAPVQKAATAKPASQMPFSLDEREVDARYDAALAIPFPAEVLATNSPHVWDFCVSRGRALSSPPGAVYMALHSLASFEMPHVVAKYTELLDIPSVTWKLQLGKSGDGKSLVVNFIKEILKVRRAQLQHHYEAVYKENLKTWKQQGATEDMPVKPTPPAVKTVCDDGSAVAWCHSMAGSENEGRGFVVLHECKKFMSSASNASGAFPATTLCKLWDRDDYSHDVQDYNKEFTLEKPLLVIYMAGHLEDKHECFYHGDELGIDNRLDSFALPPQVNHLSDFPLDLDKEAVYGYAANCFLASISTFHPFHFLLSYACHIFKLRLCRYVATFSFRGGTFPSGEIHGLHSCPLGRCA